MCQRVLLFFEEDAMKRYLNYFTPGEYALWGISAAAIVVSQLIVLWSMAAAEDPAYLSVVVCFAAFLAGDLYGCVNWRRMRRRQGM